MEIEEANRLLCDSVDEIKDTERLPLASSFGRVLAEDVIAPFSVPSFPKSAMDGYAVKSSEVKCASTDNPVKLRVIGERLAGDGGEICGPEGGQLTSQSQGTALRIMTGAEVPEGFDAVVRQEDTDYGEAEVSIYKSVEPYTNYCKVGEDIREGETVVSSGRKVGRIEAGVLASLGVAEVSVIRKLRVSIISTGSELREVGEILEKGTIYNSISYTIMAALNEPCFLVESSICKDDKEEIKSSITKALESSDIVITTGGVSVGKKDLLPEVLEEIGAMKLFSRVNIQPGTPTIGSVKDGKVILSLSGNPYAALANFDCYFWMVASKMTGCSTFDTEFAEAELASEYNKVSKHRRLLRAKLSDGKVYLPEKGHASSVMSNIINCNCYVDIPSETPVKVGDRVKVRIMPV